MRHAELLAHLHTRDLGREGRFFSSCDSTQTQALTWVREGAPHGAVVHAEEQTAGRGRRGRTWLSGAGSLLLSLILTRDIRAENAAHYSFIAGLGVRRALPGTLLKWPNDIWWQGRKVGGVLASLETHPSAIVIGIGLNLSFDPTALDDTLASRATALEWQGSPPALLADILSGLEYELARYQALGAAATLAAAREALALRGEKVRVRTQDGMLEGTVFDLAENFALQLATTQGVIDVALGDVWPVEAA